MDPADQLNGVVASLAHAPDAWDPHGEEDEAFNPFGTLGNTFGVEDTLRSTLSVRKDFQDIIG